MKNILILSAHADDETLGMGGTLARLAGEPGVALHWLIATRIWEPKWSAAALAARERAIATLAADLEMREVVRWDHRDNLLDTVPRNTLQEALIGVLDRIRPQVVYTPSAWDFNFEHRLLFELVEMSAKPCYSPYVEEVLAYEIPSATDAAFQAVTPFPANAYVDIHATLDRKLAWMRLFDTELHAFPHPRSEEYVRALAQQRGGAAGLRAAEAFVLCRRICR